MSKSFLFFSFFLFVCSTVFSQKKDNSYRIKISDNRNQQYLSYDYLFKNDSLKISGLSDNGRSNVDFYSIKLKKKQQKKITSYLKLLIADSLQTEYFDDFFSFGAITADRFPRVIQLEYRLGLSQYQSKATNCHVQKMENFFIFLNQFIPKESVKLKFNKSDFKKSY